MPSSCVVVSCTDKYTHETDVSFHKFPTDPVICQKWIDFSGRRDWKPTRWSSICSRHFKKTCFKDYLMRKCLKPDAIPTLLMKEDESSPMNATTTPETDLNTENNSEYRSEIPTEEVVTNSEYTENDFVEEENDETLHESELERLVDSLCRLCAGTFEQSQLVCYSSFLNLMIKCFPTLNLENYEYFPKQICVECREKLISFSIFIDKTMTAQNYLTDKLVHNLPNISERHLDNKKIMPRIKQEPIVVIKEEKIDKKIEFNPKTKGTLHGLRDKITFKDSKHCEIIKIVNLNTPLIDLRQHRQPSSPQKKRVSTPQVHTVDDDIEILSPTPLKVEEIIEGDEIEENRVQILTKVDHNYSRSPYTGKIEILEERVFKTEVTDFNTFIDDASHEFNRLCTICNFIFDSSAALQQHHFESHLEQKNNKNEELRVCTLCNTGFESVYKYLRHKQLTHMRKIVTCRHCGKYFTNKKLYKKHITRKCPIIKYRNRRFRQRRHARIEYLRDFLMDHKQEAMTSMRDLIEEASKEEYLYIVEDPIHEEIIETKAHEPRTCSKCGRHFSKHTIMRSHELSHRPIEQWDNLCRFCEQLFDRPNDLHWHVRYTCTGVKNLKIKKSSSSHTFYSCRICNATVSSLWSLKNHENIHTKQVIYKCRHPNCPRTFLSKQNVVQHTLTHTDDRNYQCHLCEKSYKRSNGLSQHINSFHFNVKPHVCTVCRKSYALKTDMIRCKHSLLKHKNNEGATVR